MNQKLFRGSLDTIIIDLLSKNEELYGYEITQIVKSMSDGSINITEGALYPALHRLEANGTLVSTNKNIGNRIRKYYSLTEEGNEKAPKVIEEMSDFLEQMSKLLNLQNKTI